MIESIVAIVGKDSVYPDEPMSRHTTYKIGGPARYLIEPNNVEELRKLITLFDERRCDFLVFGNGSNLLVEDKGLDTYVIKIERKLSNIRITGEIVEAEAGVLLSALAKRIQAASLTGFEFASGIPGTLGGAVFMNAGAYGGEMKDVVEWVEVLDRRGTRHRLTSEEMGFGYRHSVVKEKRYVVVKASLRFRPGDMEEIKKYTAELTRRRVEKQPLELPSCGSVFKRPEGYFAGPLIDSAGMKGCRIGDAQVSTKHSGFIVNLGKATASDVMSLIELVQKRVYETSGVRLEREIEFFGKSHKQESSSGEGPGIAAGSERKPGTTDNRESKR